MRRISLSFILCLITVSYSFAQHQTYSGNGDDVITIDKPTGDMPALLQISGNYGGGHFAIKGYDARGNRTELLVNTTDSYSGTVPLDLGTRTNTKRLEISSSNSWDIEVYSIGSARTINVPDMKSGSGDDVLWVDGSPGIMQLSGNDKGRHFAAYAYDNYGNRLKLLVNTTQPYNGKVIIPSETTLIKISASGDWDISLE